MKPKKTLPALALALFLSLILTACGAAPKSEPTSAGSDSATTGTSAKDSQTNELEGKPWVTSILQNNLPPERPNLKDDMYTSYNYDYLSAHQKEGGSPAADHSNDLRNAVTAVIKDGSKTNHDLEQLRIFYNQAADRQAIKEAGLTEIQPYLDRIDAVKSIEQMNELLVSDDFPFRPFIAASCTTYDADQSAWLACDNRNSLTQIVSKTYVEDCLGTKAKERLTELSKRVINTYKILVDNTAWLGEESQQRVIEKLDNMTLNVLEPADGYRDYSNLELTPTNKGGTLFSNYLKIKKHQDNYEAALVGKPAIASGLWFSAEPTLSNAFYEPTSNSINIMPGYITSGSYTDDMSDEELLADLGYTISHEISHGFDYMGAQLDAYGLPNPVFTNEDVDKFTQKTSALAAYYSNIELRPGVKVDGQNVVGEASADLAGMQVILQIASEDKDFDYNKFFSSVAKEYAQVITEEDFAGYAADIHPMGNLRTNVNVQMFNTIYNEFGITKGDGMYLAPEKRIVMWGPDA